MNKALFLDRDGIINIDKGYVHTIQDFEFNEGIFELCRAANTKGYIIIVATNQSGIGRGLYSEEEFLLLSAWMRHEFIKRGSNIAKIYYCPHHHECGAGDFKQQCFHRKPNPGMLLTASQEFLIDISQSLMVGDKDSDMLAAKLANINKRIFFNPNETSYNANYTVKSLLEIIPYL